MYQAFTHSNKNYSRASYSHNNHYAARSSRRKVVTFDPSLLVKQVVDQNLEAQQYIAKHQFTDFAINEQLKHNILTRAYKSLTPIQDQAIPHILAGKDIIGLAKTGTGKTAAFLIPLINKVYQQAQSHKVLIMAPTRELAIQIEAEFKLFAKNMNLYSSLCIGGTSINQQVSALKRKYHFVIGTPGRLIDLEKRHQLNFNSFSTIVLDEVDQMFDMGFIHDMKYVIARLPKQRHSLFFSATLPSKLDSIVQSFLTNPIKIAIESQKVATNVKQNIVKINGQSKTDLLYELLNKEGFDKVLVFGRTKHGLNKLAKILFEKRLKVAVIHGNKSQSQRQRALKQFKQNLVQVLLATDIAARGLDIDNVTHVINFDLPQTYEDYIHRIGRTGRADKTGVAFSFVE